MDDHIIRAPRFDFGAAVTQIFDLPGWKGYLFRVLGAGTVVLLLGFVLLGIPIVKAYIEMFARAMLLETQTTEPDPAQIMALMQPIFAAMGFFTLLYAVQYGTYIAVETALYRNIIHGEDKGLFPLRFGYDELRVLGTRIIIAILLYAIFLGVYLVGAILGAIIFGLLGAVSDPGIVAAIAGVVFFLLLIALMIAMIYLAVRFAPASAISVRDREFSPLSSWKMMKSYVWPTFGAVLVVGILGYIALAILGLIAFGLLLYTSGLFQFLFTLDAAADQIPDFGPLLDSLTSAGFIIPLVIISVISVFLSLFYMGAIWSIWGYIAKITKPQETPQEA